MKKKRIFKRFSVIASFALAFLMVAPGLFNIAGDIKEQIVLADGNTVSFRANYVEANDSNICYATLKATGSIGQSVTVTYKTYSGTAIENVDYQGVNNKVTINITSKLGTQYTIAVKCLNDSSTREVIRVKEGNNNYGRYFHLEIVDVENGSKGSIDSCKCYLPYEYTAEAKTNVTESTIFGDRKIAYLEDYKNMLMQYDDGEEKMKPGTMRKSWEHGINFNNDTTRKWVNAFINRGLANAYGSFLIKKFKQYKDCVRQQVMAGNQEFIDNYTLRASDNWIYDATLRTPGKYFAARFDPPGTSVESRSMYYMARWKNPYKEDKKLMDSYNDYIGEDHREIYWNLDRDTWFSSKNSIYSSTFYKVEPHNGVLNQGLAVYNFVTCSHIYCQGIWMLMQLCDDNAPALTNSYTEYDVNAYNGAGALRIYLRFNEPVYAYYQNYSSINVKINNYSTNYEAVYVEGNYSDTLVYEVREGFGSPSLPKERITSVTYELPNNDIGDMAYNMDSYKSVKNNKIAGSAGKYYSTSITTGFIDLAKPTLNVDIASSGIPNNVYNIMLSANDNGTTNFDSGTVYYSIDTKNEEEFTNPALPSSYNKVHNLTSEEQGSFTVSIARNTAEGISSGNYYIHALAISDYGFKDFKTFGPYRLDTDALQIDDLKTVSSTLKLKNYVFNVKDKDLGTEIKSISAVIKYSDNEGEKTSRLPLVVDGSIVPGLSGAFTKTHDDENKKTTYKYISNIDLDSDFVKGLMSTNERFVIDIHFEIADAAGNKGKTNTLKAIYDTRNIFTAEISKPASYEIDTSLDVGSSVYDISNATDEDGLTFTITDPDIKTAIDSEDLTFKIVVNDTLTFNATSEVDPGKYEVVLKGLKPGYYEAVGYLTKTIAEVTSTIMVAEAFTFYLTKGLDDNTANKAKASGNLVLTNHVYQLNSTQFYYYSSSDKISSHLYGAIYNNETGKYEGGSSNPTFSSSVEAKKYIKYMEYQDLDLISISDTIASLLNGGTGTTVYVKANGETTYAQAGQLWIRYKRSSWTESLSTNGWCFYYYGQGNVDDGINIYSLSTNLNNALETVTNRIVSNGQEVYLVEEENLNSVTGAPYLASSQIHSALETVTTTKSGISYVSNPTYQGDSNIYQNNVVVENNPYPLASNLKLSISENTALYYQYIGSNEWVKINVEDGITLKNALSSNSAGVYKIREYDNNGASEFSVYLDNALPSVKVILNEGLPNETPLTLDGSYTDTIACTTLTIKQMLEEVDDLAYVAIYSYPSHDLKKVIYNENISDYLLSGSNYYLQVGDRSGNIMTYTVLTSTGDIELSVSENESQTAVIVKVNNRDEDEIYSYEVYLNEVLIDNEFAASKAYRDSGVYRVEVTDIYGNTKTSTITHETPSPELTWYYLNENGGYSIYDPNNPVRIILEDSTSLSRTTFAYSSTLVRILISSEYESGDVDFEITGLESTEYTFNGSTGLLAINALKSFTLKVWYQNKPDSDRTYIFVVDSASPEVSASFIGSTYEAVVIAEYDEDGKLIPSSIEYTASFSTINYEKYVEGDLVTLDGLQFTTSDSNDLSFENTAVISSKRIVLGFSDQSGIKSVSVTRNGQEVSVELDSDNQIILNSYGSYVVVVTDRLSNVSIFRFINLEGAVTSAAIDAEIINADEENYGHDNLEVSFLYSGSETIYINDGLSSNTYIFNYDENTLTYGQYEVVIRETYGDTLDDGSREIITEKTSEFKQNTSFVLYTDKELTTRNSWYLAINEQHFLVYALIDNDSVIHIKVCCSDTEIYVETLYEIANRTHLPSRYVAYLSSEIPNITLLTDGEVVDIKDISSYIYITDDLTIDKDSVSNKIAKIEYSYAELPIFEEYTTIYENGKWNEFIGKEEGFYQIIVTNKYNNKNVYNISKITSFVSIVTIHTLDNSYVTYYDNEGTIHSNYAIELKVYSDNVRFEIDGHGTEGYREGGVTILTLNREGLYHVKVIGENGITENFTFEIKNDLNFLFKEEWITGYNQEALLYDKGYTNKACSIVLGEDVVFIDMVVNDDLYVKLYDSITADKMMDESILVEAIGRYGVGKYVVGFRNKYGDLVTKAVYYNNIPSLTLSRITTADTSTYQSYDLAFAIEKGFYSNYVLGFSTTSETYKFTINGVSYRLDEMKTLEFTNISGTGSFSYLVTFLDEYGNYVEFEAILYRADVEFDASSMSTMTVNGNLYTKDDICITFTDDLKATLSVDGAPAVDYKSGEMHFADGEYRFVIRDIAGNTVTYVINHKSMNHYSLTDSTTGNEIISGGVINNGTVIFTPSDDSRIKYVVRNGELVTDYNSNTFTVTGHYEVIIEDSIGNQSYESFYIINNSLCEFTYTSPFDYEITEVWRVNEDGTRELLNYRGPSITLNTNGDYVVVVTSTKIASSFNFTITIDRTVPTASLVGAENGGVTAENVTLTGLNVGDTVEIYKDGELISTTVITVSTDSPTISTGGNYRVVITNKQGMTVEYNFTRKAITNVAGSIFIIVSSVLLVTGIGIGLVYHTKLKTDD